MNFVKSLSMFHTDAKEIPCLTEKGAPSVQTEGAPGVLYMDTDTGELYKCTAADNVNKVFTWKPLGNPESSENIELDNTLSVEGKAADAKAVGDALSNVGKPTDEQVDTSVSAWLDEHPEATTTVEDGSISADKLADDVFSGEDTGFYTLEEVILHEGSPSDNPIYDISEYLDLMVADHYKLYDSEMTQIREKWGIFVKSIDNTGAAYVEYCNPANAANAFVKAVVKKPVVAKKLQVAGKYDNIVITSEKVNEVLTYSAEGHRYTDDVVDFSKPITITNTSVNWFASFFNSHGDGLAFDVGNGEEFTVPEYVKSMNIGPYTGAMTIKYYKKIQGKLTIPEMRLTIPNFTPETLEYLSETLNVGDNSSLDDVRTDRNLVWSEDFNTNKVNPNNWQLETGTGRRGYLRSSNEHPEINAFVNNGELNLRILRDHPHGGFDWSGAILRSTCKFQFLYGRIEAKIKFPGIGGYMSFWLMGQNATGNLSETNSGFEEISNGYGWPKCGELDIAESDGGNVGCDLHCQNADGEHGGISGVHGYSINATEDYHIYALEWTKTEMSVYLDESLVKTFDITQCEVNGFNPFNLPMHIVLSILNGNGSIGKVPPENVNERTGQIKWVRVYAPAGIDNLEPESIAIDGNTDASYVEKSVGDAWIPNLEVTPTEVVNRTAMWTSSNTDVAIVCPDGGYVECVGTGYATITCTMYNGVQASVIVHVS